MSRPGPARSEPWLAAPAIHDPPLDQALRRIRWLADADTPVCALLDEVVREVARALRVPLCKVVELEATGRWFTVVAGVGWDPVVLRSACIGVGSSTLAGLTLRLGTPVVCTDLARSPSLRDAALLRQHAVTSSVSAPVSDGDGPIGVLSAHTTARREFSAAETRFLARAAAMLCEGLRGRRVLAPAESQRRPPRDPDADVAPVAVWWSAASAAARSPTQRATSRPADGDGRAEEAGELLDLLLGQAVSLGELAMIADALLAVWPRSQYDAQRSRRELVRVHIAERARQIRAAGATDARRHRA